MPDQYEQATQETVDTTANEREQRRKAVRNILLGGGAAVTASQATDVRWAKPILDSVVLPAHASTTEEVLSASDSRFAAQNAVYLSYECTDTSSTAEVLIDIGGHISLPIAGVKVKLVLTWTSMYSTPTEDPPMEINVVTNADGSYSSTGNNIGRTLDEVTVTASLPDVPAAGTANDTINPNYDSSSYYCLAPDTET